MRRRGLLTRGDVVLTKTLVHTLKGVAGNLCMDKLFVTASALDRVLKEGRDDEIEPHLRELEHAHRELLIYFAGLGIPQKSGVESQSPDP